VLCAALLWSYWPVLSSLWRDWQTDPNYSVGQLVPLVVLYLLWHDRAALQACRLHPAWIAGGALCGLALAARLFGLLFMYESAERYALVVTVAALALLAGGWLVLRRAGWMLAILLLMVPLPGRINNAISGPLQDLATAGAVFTLEVCGVDVEQEGRVMLLNGHVPIAVAEACNGLRMLTAFVLVAATLAFVINRPRWQKMVLVLSSVPVALACNILRLVITAVLFLATSSETAERFFHDFAGLTMMPAAVALLAGELWLLGKIGPRAEGREPGTSVCAHHDVILSEAKDLFPPMR
jgi:exosortase